MRIRVDTYQPVYFDVVARLLVDRRYRWDDVAAAATAALVATFGFERRSFVRVGDRHRGRRHHPGDRRAWCSSTSTRCTASTSRRRCRRGGILVAGHGRLARGRHRAAALGRAAAGQSARHRPVVPIDRRGVPHEHRPNARCSTCSRSSTACATARTATRCVPCCSARPGGRARRGQHRRAVRRLVHRDLQRMGRAVHRRPARCAPPARPIDDPAFTQRAYVANTIAYRRRKGTAGVLEQLAGDLTGWPALVVEFFEQLVTTQHVNHVRLARTGHRRRPRARLRCRTRRRRSRRCDAPPTSATSTTAAGRYNIPNVGVFLWRLQATRWTV